MPGDGANSPTYQLGIKGFRFGGEEIFLVAVGQEALVKFIPSKGGAAVFLKEENQHPGVVKQPTIH